MQLKQPILTHKAIFILGVSLAAPLLADSSVERGDIRVIEHVYQILDKDMIKVTFEEGHADLSDSTMSGIADFVKATRDQAKVERYLVASWSDREFPAKGEVSSGQRKLADDRSENIKKALEAAGAGKVDTFEMTKQPNWIQRVFSTESAGIKNKGMSNTHNERLMKDIGNRLREKGGPRTAVIVAKFKNEVLAKH